MPAPKATFTLEKPWVILGINRKHYAAVKPWKKAGMN
jgi:hypothetical protein